MGTRRRKNRIDLTVPGLLTMTVVGALLAMGVPGLGDSSDAEAPSAPAAGRPEVSGRGDLETLAPFSRGTALRSVSPVRPARTVEDLWSDWISRPQQRREVALVRGRCLDPHTDRPIAGLEVQLERTSGLARNRGEHLGLTTTHTDDRGEYFFAIEHPDEGDRFAITMHGDGLARHGASLGRVLPDRRYDDPGSPMAEAVDREITVVDSFGYPVQHADLVLEEPIEPLLGLSGRSLPSITRRVRTDASGRASLNSTHPSARITAVLDPEQVTGYRTKPSGSNPDRIVVERSARVIRGLVLDSNGKGVRGVLVELTRRAEPTGVLGTAESLDDGRFALFGFEGSTSSDDAPTDLSIRIRPSTPTEAEPQPVAVAWGESDVRLHADPEFAKTIRIASIDGERLEHLTLFAQRVASNRWETCPRIEEDANGRATFGLWANSGLRLCAVAERNGRVFSRFVPADELQALGMESVLHLGASRSITVRCLNSDRRPVEGQLVLLQTELTRPDLMKIGELFATSDANGDVQFEIPSDFSGIRISAGAEPGADTLDLSDLDEPQLRSGPLELFVGHRVPQPIEVLLPNSLDPGLTPLCVLIRERSDSTPTEWLTTLRLDEEGRVEPVSLETGVAYEFGFGWSDSTGRPRHSGRVFGSIEGASRTPICLDVRGHSPAMLTLRLPNGIEDHGYRSTDRTEGLQRIVDGTPVGPIVSANRTDGGELVFEALIPGRYVPALRWPSTQTIELRSSQSAELQLEVDPEPLGLQLLDETSRAIPHANVEIRGISPTKWLAIVTSDKNGRISLWPAPSGQVLLAATTGTRRYCVTLRLEPGHSPAPATLTEIE
ncbi:MAG: hypothetical protein AAF196_15350 [Planctomycetota bacterium]